VQQDGITRYPKPVESAVYFCCLEAMQNAAKHAAGAGHITIDLSDNGALSFMVADDGAGFDPGTAPAGAGFHNMRDRLGAINGELTIESEPGHGTLVKGRVPVA
jgi:signal transduction histidine kinase